MAITADYDPYMRNQELHPEIRLAEACEGARERRARGRLGHGDIAPRGTSRKRNGISKKWC